LRLKEKTGAKWVRPLQRLGTRKNYILTILLDISLDYTLRIDVWSTEETAGLIFPAAFFQD
jgi:hypothetical protein